MADSTKGSGITIEGLSDFLPALTEELPKATATNVQKRALMEAADPIEKYAQQLAPKRTGKLKESIDIGTKLSRRQRSLNNKESKVEVYVGPPSSPKAIVSEFGSARETPHPYMRPAWESNKQKALESIKDLLAEEIEKARVRIARKTAKQLAKLGA